ncbi:hypothetical protein JDS92_26455 [Bacillus cereus group sp. N12]|uniref:phospholipase D-like domain-containing protein n=1 Tax=Bacillus cereus group sp. N12 TaxID=2794586 RepID=UPI0018F69AE3|nr:phospholipase D-like domain-containing protein [Bacillus cereus group sp. N12]MBJ8078858.1 hypothetical protein [Bacillus cereus group sp. N12]
MEQINISRLYVLKNVLENELKKHADMNVEEYTEHLKINGYQLDVNLTNSSTLLHKLSKEQLLELLLLFKIYEQEQTQESVEFVATLPANIDSRFRKTISVVRQIILEAQKEILITGYAISEYFDEIFSVIINKNLSGVNIKFFIDDNTKNLSYMKTITNRKDLTNLELYKYQKSESLSSLHAKVIVVDNQKAFVSSSNLSYNGMVNNVEIGTIIIGEKVREIDNLFKQLIANKYFIKIV